MRESQNTAFKAVVQVVAIMALMTVLIVAILSGLSIVIDGSPSQIKVTAAP